MTQRSTMPCDDCGALVVILPTSNRREFVYRCTTCANRGSISWSTAHEPPRFETAAEPAPQLALFELAS